MNPSEADRARETERTNRDLVWAKIGRTASWCVLDVDRMSKGDAYVFYLRSKLAHSYRNILGETMRGELFDLSVVVPSELIVRDPARAEAYIVEEANSALEGAKGEQVW